MMVPNYDLSKSKRRENSGALSAFRQCRAAKRENQWEKNAALMSGASGLNARGMTTGNPVANQ